MDYQLVQYGCDECGTLTPVIDSMTEEEQIKFSSQYELTTDSNGEKVWSVSVKGYDWLNSNFFDYRKFIPRGMAYEAKEGMYKMFKKNVI